MSGAAGTPAGERAATRAGAPAQRWSDVLLAGLLTVGATLGWMTTFQGFEFWVVVLTATALGLLVTVAVTRLGGGLEFVLLALLLVYYLVSGPVAEGFASLRDLSGFAVGLNASVEALPLLLGTYPPVDAVGPVRLVPLFVCLASAGASAGLAARSTRVAVPLVPPVLALAAVLLLAQPEPVSTLVQGLGFGVVAVLWVRIRALRREWGPRWVPLRRRSLLSGVLTIVLAALVVGLVVQPHGSGGRLVLRQEVGAYDPSTVPTPLDRFRDFSRDTPREEGNVHDDNLFKVSGAPKGMRLRFATLDAYDGQRWYAANDTDPGRTDDRFLRIASRIDNPSTGRLVGFAVAPSVHWKQPWVPTAGDLQSFDFVGSERSDARDNLRYDPATRTALMTDQLEPGDVYEVTTKLTYDVLKRTMRPYAQRDTDLYDAAAFLERATRSWSAGTSTPMQALFQVASRLRSSGRYSNGVLSWEQRWSAGQVQRRLGRGFVLAVPTVGNDEQYAAAMALFANRLGIPARVVVGAVVASDGVVQGKDVQAWVEVRVADGSWRTLPTERFMGRKPPKRPAEQSRPAVRAFPPVTDLPQQQPQQQDEPRQRPRQPDAKDDHGLLAQLPWLLLVVLVLLAVSPLLLKQLRRRRRRRAALSSMRVVGAWSELTDTARDLGHEVRPGLTRPGEARVLGRDVELARTADRVIFAPDEPSDDLAEEFWGLVEAELAELRAGVPRWRQVWSRFTPRSLWPL